MDVATDCARTAEGSCGKRLNKFSYASCLHWWGGLSAFRSAVDLTQKGSGVIEMDSRLKPQVRQRCRACDALGGGCVALALRGQKALRNGKSKPSSGCRWLQRLWLFSSYLPEQLPPFCGFISVGEVSSRVGSCWCVLRARQRAARPAPLSGATVVALTAKAWSEQFLGSAVRFDKRNPTGFSKQDGLCGREECTPGDLS